MFDPKTTTVHEHDTELGRWRERPGCTTVVYPNGADVLGNRCVIVLFEPIAGMTMVYENKIPENLYGDAAKNYFAAHPDPKPWHDAKPGEVWALTYGGQETAHVWTDRWAGQGNAFVSDRAIVEAEDPDITAARRIWPEVVSDDS